ncbi:hypothetical protein PFISCL1PPCAC_6734, partial [Pristionchus fissidentatus]
SILCMSILATGIYYRLKGEHVFRGPFSEEEVLEWYRSGWFTSTTAFRFDSDDSVVTLRELCDSNGSASPFRSTTKAGKAADAHDKTPSDGHKACELRHMQEQIDATNLLLQASVDRCTKLEQIVSSVVERFLLFSGELSDVKEEWKSIRDLSVVTGASSSLTSSTTTLASAASSSSSLNLLMQLKDDLNALDTVLRGGECNEEAKTRSESREMSEKEEERGGRKAEMGNRRGAAGDVEQSTSCVGCGVKRTESGLSTASTTKRTNSSEEDDGDFTIMETVDEVEKPQYHPASQHAPTMAEYTSMCRRIGVLETSLRQALERIEEMKAADLSHVFESIDRVNDEMNANQNEMKTQRALDRGSVLVLEDAVHSLKKDRTVDRERLTDVERFMGRMTAGLEDMELIGIKTIRSELRAAKDREEFSELKMYGIEDKLRNHTFELETTTERLATLEEATTKMLTLETFKSMLTDHAEELNSQMKKSTEDVLDVTLQMTDRIDKVEKTTSLLSVHMDELKETVEELVDDTQNTGEEWDEEDSEYCEEEEDCSCAMCREGKTPKVISDLLNGHRGHFDQARIATRADLIDIRDALSVRRRRSSFIEDTRHYFGEGVRCEHCDVTIREGVSLLSHVSSERHAQATCILKEDLRFWWNRIRNADE